MISYGYLKDFCAGFNRQVTHIFTIMQTEIEINSKSIEIRASKRVYTESLKIKIYNIVASLKTFATSDIVNAMLERIYDVIPII